MKKADYLLTGAALLAAAWLLYRKYRRGPLGLRYIVNELPAGAGTYKKRDKKSITDITVHHSGGPISGTPYDFARFHVFDRGWPGIGYHFVISYEGVIYQTNDLDTISYHNGFNNSKAVGICLPGNFDNTKPSAAQLAALDKLIRYIIKETGATRLAGHNEYPGAATACPGRNMKVNNLRYKHKLKPYPTLFSRAATPYNPGEADN